MKVKVINIFRDKSNNLIQEIGTEMEVLKERFEEINSTSFGIFLEELTEETVEGVTEDIVEEVTEEVKEVKKKTTKK